MNEEHYQPHTSLSLKHENTAILEDIIQPYNTIIFDVGDVILNWESAHPIKAGGQICDLRAVLQQAVWKDYEKGTINREVALSLLEYETGIDKESIEFLLESSKSTLTVNTRIVNLLKDLTSAGKVLICLSNMDRDSFAYLLKKYQFWSYFDRIYVSSVIKLSKPSLQVYQYVIESSGLESTETLFIDNKTQNLEAAFELGVDTFNFSSSTYTAHSQARTTTRTVTHQFLRKRMAERLKMASQYLYKSLYRSPFCRSVTSMNEGLTNAKEFSSEVFSTLIIAHTHDYLPADLQDTMCDEILRHNQTNLQWCFFKQESRPENFPTDLDTTSMALSFLLRHGRVTPAQVQEVIVVMLNNRNRDGVIQVYFDPERPRVDAAVATNVLYLMYQSGYGQDECVDATINYVLNFLETGDYLNGTRYYPLPEVFLFFLTRVMTDFPEPFEAHIATLKQHLVQRIVTTDCPIGRALRVISLSQLGVVNGADFNSLMDEQLEDGGWQGNGLFIAAKSKLFFGSRELTTSFAIDAMCRFYPGLQNCEY